MGRWNRLSLLVASAFSLCACSGGAEKSSHITYVIGDYLVGYYPDYDGFLIEDYRGSPVEALEIPAFFTYEGKTHPITGIHSAAFVSRKGIKVISLGESCSYIGEGAFEDTDVEALIATPRLVHFNEASFKGCPLNFPAEDGVKYVPSAKNPYCCAFGATEGMKLNANVESVADHAFDGVSDTPIALPDCIRSIGDSKEGTFTLDRLGTSIKLLHIGDYALAKSNVVSLDLSEARGKVGDYAFYQCSSLSSLKLGPAISAIGSYCFVGTKIDVIDIPQGVRKIGDWAFAAHKGHSIYIPETVEEIGASIFDFGTYSTVSIPLKKAAAILGPSAFISIDNIELSGSGTWPAGLLDGRTSFRKLTFAGALEEIPENFLEGCTQVKEIDFKCSLEEFMAVKHRERILRSVHLYLDGSKEETTHLEIPQGTTEIRDVEFAFCVGLTSLTIPEGVTRIGENAFLGNNFRTVALPSTLKEIGDWAFDTYSSSGRATTVTRYDFMGSVAQWLALKGKSNLIQTQNIHLLGGSGGSEITSIESSMLGNTLPDYAFLNCTGLKAVTFPKNLTEIGESAFRFCESLTSITLPASLKKMGDGAFAYCYELKEIRFEGTKAQWRAIPKDSQWAAYVSTGEVTCADGILTVYD